MSANTLQDHPFQNRGEQLPGVSQGESTEGQTLFHYDQQVDVKHVPDFDPVFGIMNMAVLNEKSRRRSRLSYDNLNIDDLFEPEVKTNQQELNPHVVTSTKSIVDATGGLPDPDPNAFLQIESEVHHLDRAHGEKNTQTVDYYIETIEKIQHHRDAGGNARHVKTETVPAATVLASDDNTIRASLDPVDETKSTSIIIEAPDGFGVVQNRNSIDSDALGCETLETNQAKPNNFSFPAADWLTVRQTLRDLGNNHHMFSRTKISAWEVFIDQEEEPETGEEVLVTRTIVNRASLPTITKGEARVIRTMKNLDCYKGLLVERTIDADILATTYTEFHNVKYYFPSYMDATNPFSVVTLGGLINVTTNKSSDHQFSIPCRFETTFLTTPGTVDEIFQFKAVDVNFSTPFVNAPNVLTDEGVVQFLMPVRDGTDSDGTPEYEHVELSYGISASSPTTTEYLALMGTEVLIADEVTRWKYNLWKRTKVFMNLPDLSLGLGGYLSY